MFGFWGLLSMNSSEANWTGEWMKMKSSFSPPFQDDISQHINYAAGV